MKLVFALVVFILALSLTFKTIAEEQHKTEPAACTAGQTENCGHAAAESHGGGHGDLTAKMNSLFPEHKSRQAEVGLAPKTTKLLSPKFLAKVTSGSVKLEWSEIPGATHYHLQVATDPNFKWLVLNNHFTKGNSADFATAEANTRYYWRVASVKDNNLSMHNKSNFVSSAFDAK
ncbi:MAG: hypothetical protein A2622_06435 [Bdellovibrionales bacterium RIFCSPHIGHO2_01_FULL_40_29]|nr:MAG: hypothetical protein A2622_06435 [Bdellovibrionales bacterium RIFCSPHIGHO2_01_FULL_40_29]OFZ35081.1 MAG: hypothetical protein A3D17_06785 [Bdellovibrionales bacterium RIFCSPHIGHO2_02_FULL_40_15]